MRRTFEAGYKLGLILCFWSSICLRLHSQQLTARDFGVLLTATIADNPAEIQLHWAGDQNAKTYQISRKLLSESTWNSLAVVGGGDTAWSDRNVRPGIGYEYQVIKTTTFDYTGYGYIYAGMRLPLTEQRGKILLVIEQSLLLPLRAELDRLEYDLVGDGWTVSRLVVSAQDTVFNVKKAMVAQYNNDPVNTKAALLLGHVPVPY